MGVAGLSVDHSQIHQPDGLGNVLRYSAAIDGTPGSTVGMTAWDVQLTSPTRAEREEHDCRIRAGQTTHNPSWPMKRGT